MIIYTMCIHSAVHFLHQCSILYCTSQITSVHLCTLSHCSNYSVFVWIYFKQFHIADSTIYIECYVSWCTKGV